MSGWLHLFYYFCPKCTQLTVLCHSQIIRNTTQSTISQFFMKTINYLYMLFLLPPSLSQVYLYHLFILLIITFSYLSNIYIHTYTNRLWVCSHKALFLRIIHLQNLQLQFATWTFIWCHAPPYAESVIESGCILALFCHCVLIVEDSAWHIVGA